MRRRGGWDGVGQRYVDSSLVAREGYMGEEECTFSWREMEIPRHERTCNIMGG